MLLRIHIIVLVVVISKDDNNNRDDYENEKGCEKRVD